MTHTHKLIAAMLAPFAFAAFAQTSNTMSGTTGTTSSTTDSATGDSATTMQMDRDPAMIRQVQQALKDRGHYAGTVDGVWGSRSKSGLRDFQRSQGITESGSTFDQPTLSALGIQSAGTGLGTSSSPAGDMPGDSTTRQGRSPTSDMTDDTAPTDTDTDSTPGQGRIPSDQ